MSNNTFYQKSKHSDNKQGKTAHTIPRSIIRKLTRSHTMNRFQVAKSFIRKQFPWLVREGEKNIAKTNTQYRTYWDEEDVPEDLEIVSDAESVDAQNSIHPPETRTKRKKKPSANMVLPSYEELLPDNSVERLKPAQTIYQRALHSFKSLYHYWTDGIASKDSSISVEFDRLTMTPFDIKKVVVIGVHGWFPNKIFNPIIGDPKGTSTRFGQKMQTAIQVYFKDRYGIELNNDQIDMIPLDGQGRVLERVEIFHEQIMDPSRTWKQTIQDADLIVFSAHSQGTPVSTILLSKLMNDSIVNPRKQRTGILAMAGISHGPFPSMKSSLVIKFVEADPAKELFDFVDPHSQVSKVYISALRHVLTCGTRFAAIGSWYDQVVPLYSATLQGIHHPSIYRALYIDAVDYQPDFLSHLFVFALKLRNHGYSDHGLINHCSDVIAGSVYGFGTQGHSAIYEELNTYVVGFSWIIGQRTIWKDTARFESFAPPVKPNPYYLPWIMAQLTKDEDINQNEEFRAELEHIQRLYLSWMPVSSNLKELKYRLEPFKAKL